LWRRIIYFLKKNFKSGNIVYTPILDIAQKTNENNVLIGIKEYFNLGNIYHEKRGISKFRLTKISDHLILKEHFNKYPLHGYKELQYKI
jgi:hypothetical protein